MTKISQYTALAVVPDTALVPVVDTADTSMAPSGTTKHTTAGALRSSLLPSGDTSAVTDSANVQALYSAGAGTIALGAGQFYMVNLQPSSFSRLTGRGRGVTIISNDGVNPIVNVGAAQTDTVEIDHVTLSATGADIFSGTANCVRWHVHHAELDQASAGNSIWHSAAVTVLIESTFDHNIERVHGATRTVPAWSVNSAIVDGVTQCVWQQNVCFNSDSDATQYYFSLICSASNALLRNNTWRDLTFEHACGGMIHLESVTGTLIENCWSWDTPASSILQPSIQIKKNSGNSAVPAGNTILGSGRVGDGLNTGVADIQLDSNTTGTTITSCGAFGTAIVFVIDLASSANVVLTGLQSTVSLLNAIAGHIRMYNGAYLGNTGKFQQAAGSGLILQAQNTTSAPGNASVQFQAQSAADKLLALIVAADTNPRALWDSNGKLSLGPGNATQDTTLYRSTTSTLKTDGALVVGGALTTQAASLGSTPTAPASTTSASLVMQGLGTSTTGTPWVITPASSGKVLVSVTGGITTAVAIANATIGLRRGTGTPPNNGDAVTGTRTGSAGDPVYRAQLAATAVPFAFTALLSLTVGVAAWFDLAISTSNASDAASVSNVSISVVEVQ